MAIRRNLQGISRAKKICLNADLGLRKCCPKSSDRSGWINFFKRFKKLPASPINPMKKYQVISGTKIREIPIVWGEKKTYKTATGKKLVRFGSLPGLEMTGNIIAGGGPGNLRLACVIMKGRQDKWCAGRTLIEL